MWKDCKSLQPQIVALRRALHQVPEMGLDLPKTCAIVRAELDRLGIPYVTSEEDSGIVATIRGGRPGKRVALRADMDALPITEATGLPFASRHEGLMHACGHDAHTAMLLGAAQVLNARREELPGEVRLLFQPSEEQVMGAKALIARGAMDGVDAVFGLHIGSILSPDIPSGTLVVPAGRCMPSFDRFSIRVKGAGCHGSTPQKGIDPINIGAHILLALQSLNAREVSATDPLVLTIGKFIGNGHYNVIPDEVLMEGNVRTLDPAMRQFAAKRIGEIAEGTAAMFGGSAEYEMLWGIPPVVNQAEMAALAAEAAAEVAGAQQVITRLSAPNMGGEDFACYLEQAPGAFAFLSSADHAKGTDGPHHTPRFDVDEDVLWEGAAYLVAVAERFLNR